MKYCVIFSPEAEEQLAALYNHTADAATPDIAQRYTRAIVNYYESMTSFPIRGTRRDDVRPGLRVTNYKKRMVIAFAVDSDSGKVSILGLFYGGQDGHFLILADALNMDRDQPLRELRRKLKTAISELIRHDVLMKRSGFVEQDIIKLNRAPEALPTTRKKLKKR